MTFTDAIKIEKFCVIWMKIQGTKWIAFDLFVTRTEGILCDKRKRKKVFCLRFVDVKDKDLKKMK